MRSIAARTLGLSPSFFKSRRMDEIFLRAFADSPMSVALVLRRISLHSPSLWDAITPEGLAISQILSLMAVYCSGLAHQIWDRMPRSEEHTSELQSHHDIVC